MKRRRRGSPSHRLVDAQRAAHILASNEFVLTRALLLGAVIEEDDRWPRHYPGDTNWMYTYSHEGDYRQQVNFATKYQAARAFLKMWRNEKRPGYETI